MEAVVILSGGMDSTVALAETWRDYGASQVAALTFDYGSKHNAREGRSAQAIAAHYGVRHVAVSLPFVGEHFASDLLASGGAIPEGHYADPSMKATVVPFRNGIMLSVAVGFAESLGAGIVVYGAHAGDHPIYPDCRPAFLRAMSDAARHGTYAEVRIEAPFMARTKAEIVEEGHSLRVPWGMTYSCYNGREQHCGRCGTCVERREAFTLAGVPDPTDYEGALVHA